MTDTPLDRFEAMADEIEMMIMSDPELATRLAAISPKYADLVRRVTGETP